MSKFQILSLRHSWYLQNIINWEKSDSRKIGGGGGSDFRKEQKKC
jgi:hypothetical protein